MADISPTQVEADALIAMEKQRVEDKRWDFPIPGARISIPLTSMDKRENFILDLTRARVKLTESHVSEPREAGDCLSAFGLGRFTPSQPG